MVKIQYECPGLINYMEGIVMKKEKYSIIGRSCVNGRQENQDAFSALTITPCCCSPIVSLCLADGISKGDNGRWFARTAVSLFQQKVADILSSEAMEEADDDVVFAALEEFMQDCIIRINREIMEQAEEKGIVRGGTTFSAAIISNNRVMTANIGDSPIFMLENRELKPIYLSDSCAEVLVRLGHIQRDTEDYYSRLNLLDMFIGRKELNMQHNFTAEISGNRRIVLASDGALGDLPQHILVDYLSRKKLDDSILIDLFLKASDEGCTDNQTAIVCQANDRRFL